MDTVLLLQPAVAYARMGRELAALKENRKQDMTPLNIMIMMLPSPLTTMRYTVECMVNEE